MECYCYRRKSLKWRYVLFVSQLVHPVGGEGGGKGGGLRVSFYFKWKYGHINNKYRIYVDVMTWKNYRQFILLK